MVNMSVNLGERKAALSEKRRNLLLVVFESIVGILLAASVILAIYSGTYEGAGLIALFDIITSMFTGRAISTSLVCCNIGSSFAYTCRPSIFIPYVKQ